ncbi:IS3 family transposase [Pantoea agglomerans]
MKISNLQYVLAGFIDYYNHEGIKQNLNSLSHVKYRKQARSAA